MKTSLRSWQNLFSKGLLACLFLISPSAWPQAAAEGEAKGEIIGVIEALHKLMSIHRSQYNQLLDQIARNPKLLSDISELKEVSLEPHFVSSLLFYSDPKYLKLLSDNECSFFGLLKNNLLKAEQGNVSGVMATYKNKAGAQENAIIPRSDFFDYLYQSKCFEYKAQDELFSPANLKEQLKKITFAIPKNEAECSEIYQGWLKSLDTPYLCGYSQTFTDAKLIQEKLVKLPEQSVAQKNLYRNQLTTAFHLKDYFDNFQYTYINNLCQNLQTPESFCEIYLAKSIWSKILNAEYSREALTYRCQALLNRPAPSDKELTSCADKFMETPGLCHYLNANLYPSLTPRPNCDEISLALKNSRLQALYQDCSGRVGNEGITNFFRVFSHLKKSSFESTPGSCATMASGQFLQANKEADNEDVWGIRICYQDKIQDKEVCLPSLLGEFTGSSFSEEKVIANILSKTISTPNGLTCRILNKSRFNPVSLEHKTGCFGLYDENNCSATSCPKSIIYNEKTYGHLRYTGSAYFDFFPSTHSKASFSMHSILKNQFRFKTNMIRNLSDLKFFFKNFDKMVVYGTGCLEDLLPHFFKKEAFNQCRPTQFIIDGFVEEQLKAFVVLRTALDDVHSPRIVPWPWIFTAVRSYQEIHPLKSWTMYGIR